MNHTQNASVKPLRLLCVLAHPDDESPPTVGWLAELFGLQPTLLLILAVLFVAMRCLAGAIEPHSRHGARVARSQAR